MSIQHEKLKVLKPCLQLCSSLEASGNILYYRRMSEWEREHVIGDADIRIELVKDATLWLILCECKRDDGTGKQSNNQIRFQKRYELCHNVIYLIVEDVAQLRKFIEELTGFEKKKLDAIIF